MLSGDIKWCGDVLVMVSRLHCTDCTAALCRAAGRKDYNVHSANKHIDTIDRYTATGDSCAML